MWSIQARVLRGRARCRCISLCVLAVTCLASRSSHAQLIPDSSALTVYVHPEVRTIIDAPEDVQLMELVGGDDFLIILSSSNRTLFLNPHASIEPHSETVLRIFTTGHEWTLVLKAVALPERATERIKLVVANDVLDDGMKPAAARGSKPHASAAAAAETEQPREDGPFTLSLRALSGRGMTWLRTSEDRAYARASHTVLGLRLAGAHRHAWWAAALDLSIAWADEPFDFSRDGERREVRPFWAQSVLQMRARSAGHISSAVFFGVGARLRMAGEIIMVRKKYTLDPMAIGALALVGLGVERRLGSGILGIDLIGEVGGPNKHWSLVILFHIGCLPRCGE